MKKRLVSLLVVAIVLVAATPVMATHCQRCKWTGAPYYTTVCAIAQTIPGYTECEDWTGACQVFGEQCPGHSFAPQDLATEFTIVSVERIDGTPQPAPQQPQVAELQPASIR